MKTLKIYPAPPRLAVEETSPLAIDAHCARCSLASRRDLKTPCMAPELWGHSDTQKRLLVVTEGPGEAEDRKGRPLVSTTGNYLRDLLVRQWPGEIVFDHAVRCASGATPIRDAMIAACRPYLAQTLQEALPERVLCFGLDAIKAVMGRGFAPMSVRGGYAYLRLGTDRTPIPVFFLMDHAQAIRNRFVRAWLEDDVRWALKALPPPAPIHAAAYRVETLQDAQEACDEIRDTGGMTLDLETFGAPHQNGHRILSMAVTPYGCDYAYVWGINALEAPVLRGDLFALLRDETIEKCGHNLKFDQVTLMARYGVTIAGHVEDTMLMRAMHATYVEKKLEMAQALVGMGGGKDEAGEYVTETVKQIKKAAAFAAGKAVARQLLSERLGAMPTATIDQAIERVRAGDDAKRYAYAGIPDDVRDRYNAADTVSTDRLRRHMLAQEWMPGTRELWRAVGSPLHHAICQMEHNGILVSRLALDHLKVAMTARAEESLSALRQWGDFNPNSAKEVGTFLFETLKLPAGKRTATGQYQTDADTLKNLKHPAATALLAYRRAVKFKVQFCEGMESYIRDDGRIHPSINVAGTATGRLSCDSPNLFNIPGKGTDDGKLCRDIFVAPPGYTLIEADFAQVEIRLAAMLSQDQTMIDIIKSGADFHLQTARLVAPVFRVAPEDVTKEHWLRTASKTINFGVLYGMSPASLAEQLKISKPQAQKLMDAIFGQFRTLKRWIDTQLQTSRRTGYVRTWWDGQDARVRWLHDIANPNDADRETAEKSSWNSRIQGSATEFTNASLGKLHQEIQRRKLPAKLILTVYDSILLEVEASATDEVAALIKQIMTSWPSMGVPIDADVKIGPAWGSMKNLGEK